MNTKYWSADEALADLNEAAAALAAGGIVAFPTETVYGLGGDAGNTEAVRRIFAAKGRPSDNPLIVHVEDASAALRLAKQVSDVERRLMETFWPGPLTLVLPVREGAVSPLVTAGLDTVAVRVPAHETARRLIAASGRPIAAPSANRSGRPSPTLAAHVREDLDGRIDGLLDGGPTGVGLESTVVQAAGDRIHILRPGGVTREMLQQAVGERVSVFGSDSGTGEAAAPQEHAPRSPGVKYAHYAPKGELLLVAGNPAAMIAAVQAQVTEAKARGLRVGVLASSEHAPRYEADAVLDCGSRSEPELAAQSLYALLRECDDRGLDFIVAEGYEERGIGAALMNRLRKAAGGRVLHV
ncbi:L-threonylcarbamoyladenylate synthase [Cohnella panacarvi]|uniref:L-threonylcarbamoyladenylate synthase n=1 Tax=Cohnella panacarvi TaxID=400776 RepID=UPI00047B8F2D|nr:L-threonylcarbamoyladenylate synthase [Cohnella panacarvi]